MRNESEVLRIIAAYADTVRRICLCRLKNAEDTEDIFQEVLLKYIRSDIEFSSDAHEKAWLIRVTINACTDLRRSFLHRREVPISEVLSGIAVNDDQWETLHAVLSIPQKYRDVIYLHYYEGYSVPEISGILKKNENTVYSLLSRGRILLKEQLGGEVR